MKNIGIVGSKVKHENIIYFGVRDIEQQEVAIINKNNIKNYSVSEMRYRGFKTCLNEAVKKLNDCDVIYISFDVDSMDSDLISKGTGTPVSKGFDEFEIIEIIEAFVETKKVACFEVVEINPTLDNKGNKMAETAFEVLKVTTEAIKKAL
jgi:arginase